MRLYLICTLGLSASSAMANDIFEYQGPYARANGGAGIILSQSGSAVLDNPANLALSQSSDNYVDVAPTHLVYQVTTPDPNTKPGAINVPVLPLLSVGGSYKEPKAPMSFGYMFIPTGFGKAVEVKNFPVSVGGQTQSTDIKALQKGFKFGVGSSYRVSDRWTLGLSMLINSAGSDTSISSKGQELVHIAYSLSSLHFNLGVNYDWDGLARISFTVRPSVDMYYNLKLQALGSATQSFYRRDYRPAVLGLGLLLNSTGQFQTFGQYAYERWVNATTYALAPTQAVAGTAPVEYLNTHNLVIGARYVLASQNKLSFAFSSYSKNKGSGLKGTDGQVLMQGRGAQDFEALDRNHYTFGYEMHNPDSDMLFYGTYIRATALSEEDTPTAGFYELTAYMLGFGYVAH